MRFQDTLRFSLELVLPEKVVRALEKINGIGAAGIWSPASQHDSTPNQLKLLIEEIDRARFGGATFGPDTIALMTNTLDRVLATRPQPVEMQEIHRIINCILGVAEDGERNPDRLRTKALAKLEQQHTA